MLTDIAEVGVYWIGSPDLGSTIYSLVKIAQVKLRWTW
jgi:hypothetical protein